MHSSTSKPSGHLTYLYVLLSCCLMVGASLGLCFYSAGVFYEPVSEGLHITMGQAGLTTTYMLVCMAAATLFVPMLMRAIPYRYLLILGTVLAAGGTLGMSFCFHSTFLYICAGIQGIGAALIGLVPATTILNRWFYSHSAAVMALCTATPALIAALVSPLFGYVLTGLGWRMAFVLLGALIVLMLLPALLLPFAVQPELLGMQPWGIKDLEPEQKTPKLKNPMVIFAAIAALSILAASLLGISQHFSGFGTSLQKDLVFGASLFSWCMIGSIVMKLLGGFLGDKIGPGLTTALLDAVLIVTSIGMWISVYAVNDIVLKVLAFLFGAAYALSDFSVPLLVKERYGARRYAKIYSLMNFLSTISIAISIAVVGFLYDSTMTYAWIWAISILLEIGILGVTYILIREEKRVQALTDVILSKMPASLRMDLHAPALDYHEEEVSDENPEQTGKDDHDFTETDQADHPVDDEHDEHDTDATGQKPAAGNASSSAQIRPAVSANADTNTAVDDSLKTVDGVFTEHHDSTKDSQSKAGKKPIFSGGFHKKSGESDQPEQKS